MSLHDAVTVARLGLFDGVGDERLVEFVERARHTALAPGQTLLREGDPGDDVLLVIDGTASVTVGGMSIGVIGPGDCVGEMSMLDGAPRSATVTSMTPLRALVISAPEFRRLLDDEPKVASRLTATLTTRLRSAQLGWSDLAGDPDVLLGALIDLQDSPDPATAEKARRQALALVEAAATKQADANPTALAPLSPAELRVAHLVAEGRSNASIAEELFVSRHTVDTHVKRCFAKLHLRSRVELATLVLRSGT